MNVLVASVAWRQFEGPNVISVFNLMTNPGFSWKPFLGDALIERSRSRAMTYFMDKTKDDGAALHR